MIKSDAFYSAFEKGFASQQTSPLIARRRGKIPKYYAVVGQEELSFWFKVNPKASAQPPLPGEFWPVIEAKQLRHDQKDNGLLSWYQYTDESINGEIKAFQWSVYAKLEGQNKFERESARRVRDAFLPSIRRSIKTDIRVGCPHDALYYLDEQDAEFWGKLFAIHLVSWMQKFCTAPETLEGYMWRVHWGKTVS
jgi:hypothetical protein